MAGTANGILSIALRPAAVDGTNPGAEGVEEVSSFGRPAAYVHSASEEFNLTARVLGYSVNQFMYLVYFASGRQKDCRSETRTKEPHCRVEVQLRPRAGR